MGTPYELRRSSALGGAILCSLASPGAPVAQPTAVEWRIDPGLEELAATLAADRWAFGAMPGIGPPVAELDGGLTVWLVSEFEGRTDLPVAGPEPWVAGYALPAERLILLRAVSAEGGLTPMRQVLRHEIAHLALHAATGGNVPRWLDEGYAQYVAGAWSAEDAWRLRFLFLRGEGALGEISLRFPRQEESAQLAYLLSYTAAAELIAVAGEIGIERVFERLRAGERFDAALRGVYGITADQFEQRWRRTVASRYGWLYVLSRASVFWVALTTALLLLGWRRRRYNRLRWEALRRADALSGVADSVPGRGPDGASGPRHAAPARGAGTPSGRPGPHAGRDAREDEHRRVTDEHR